MKDRLCRKVRKTMKPSNGKKIAIFVGIAVVVFLGVFLGITLTQDLGKSEEQITTEKAEQTLGNLLGSIKVETVAARKSAINDTDILSDEQELPDIKSYPLSVTGSGEINVEIFSSPEKAGTGTDGWLNEIAERFNSEMKTVNGKTVSVSVRSVSSGLALDYIKSGKYVPEALSPSNEFWGSMLNAGGIKTTLIEKKLCGNVAGILLSKEKHSDMVSKYGSVNMKTVAEATQSGDLLMGYTNPFVSSTGLNFLINTLYTYDADDILSSTAAEGFRTFQENVPLVSYNTLQMRNAAESGSLDAMVMEYQLYVNDPTLKNNYVFTPFGVRHDNPLYAIGDLSKDKTDALKLFAQYCLSAESQSYAEACGFNQNEKYISELPDNISGDKLLSAQKFYKENKNSGRPIVAVFVADVSGSMIGEPINALKTSLINSMQYINKSNFVGLVSFSNKVSINLPIDKFDLNQQAYFKGAVEDLTANGSTATYDAVIVALDMINKAKEQHPEAKPMIFLLSDGEQNVGHSLNEIEAVLKAYEVPVYTIGYNANIDALKMISQINEAATINADSDDIVYKLKNLFNSEM